MLVDTPFENVSQLENIVNKYVNSKIEYQGKDVFVDDFTLEDMRLELSSSAKNHTFIENKAIKQPNERFVSDIKVKPLNLDVLDIIPLELREQFKYEEGITDVNRTQLLQKNLTVVTLIQNVQKQLNEDEIEDNIEDSISDDSSFESDSNSIESDDFIIDKPTQFEDSELSTEIEDFSLEDDGEDVETFTLNDTEPSIVDDFSLDDVDFAETDIETFSLEDAIVGESASTNSEDAEVDTLEEFSLEEDNADIETTENSVDDDFSFDTTESENDNFDSEITDDFSINEPEPSNNSVFEDTANVEEIQSNETVSEVQPLSELELFKQAIGNIKDSVPKSHRVSRGLDDEEPILEDLDSISEDELDTDEIEDEVEEFESDESEDEDEIEDFETTEFEDDEIEEFEPANSEDEDEIEDFEPTKDVLETDELEDIDWENETEDIDTEESITKIEDNVDFIDTSEVNLTKVDQHVVRPTQASEWGKSIEQKANDTTTSLNAKQDFKSQFDKEDDEEDLVAPTQVTKTFVDNISREEKPVARAPSQSPIKQEKQELPPLRMYLKKHAYTPIQTLIEMGYSDIEIKDGIKRGRFINKRGTLRALY